MLELLTETVLIPTVRVHHAEQVRTLFCSASQSSGIHPDDLHLPTQQRDQAIYDAIYAAERKNLESSRKDPTYHRDIFGDTSDPERALLAFVTDLFPRIISIADMLPEELVGITSHNDSLFCQSCVLKAHCRDFQTRYQDDHQLWRTFKASHIRQTNTSPKFTYTLIHSQGLKQQRRHLTYYSVPQSTYPESFKLLGDI